MNDCVVEPERDAAGVWRYVLKVVAPDQEPEPVGFYMTAAEAHRSADRLIALRSSCSDPVPAPDDERSGRPDIYQQLVGAWEAMCAVLWAAASERDRKRFITYVQS
jgi:hypothetical protein